MLRKICEEKPGAIPNDISFEEVSIENIKAIDVSFEDLNVADLLKTEQRNM